MTAVRQILDIQRDALRQRVVSLVLPEDFPAEKAEVIVLPVEEAQPVVGSVHRRQPGSGQGEILFMADDFDAPLEDFREYME